MARSRNIKPGFFSNPELAECGPWARLCFVGLWTLADREGRLEDRPKKIKGELFRFDTVDVEPLLVELQAHGFLQRYANDDGQFVQILAFKKHQTPHYSEKPSAIMPPDFPEHSRSTPSAHLVRNPLIPDSLIPDSLIPEEDSGSALLADPPAPSPGVTKRPKTNGHAVEPIATNWELPDTWGTDAEALGFKPREVLREAEKFRQYWTAGKGAGTRRSAKGWRQSWSKGPLPRWRTSSGGTSASGAP